MERRNFVIGLGGIAASAGLIAGSGAFSQISADRTMDVTIADDSAAYLSMDAVTGAENYVTANTTTGNIELNFGQANEASGLNNDAVTSFDNLVTIGNHGDYPVDLGYSVVDSTEKDLSAAISLYTGSATGTTDDLANASLNAYDSTATPTVDTLQFGVEMDSRNADFVDTETYKITITAADNSV